MTVKHKRHLLLHTPAACPDNAPKEKTREDSNNKVEKNIAKARIWIFLANFAGCKQRNDVCAEGSSGT